MELRQIEYFVAVAEERHFTRAAARLHVAQSGLSASVRALERELGAPLFVRSTRRVELTEAGRALLAEARRTLHTVTAAREAVAAVQGLLRGSLSIGTIQCLGGIDLAAALGRFRTAHPGVEIQLRQESTPDLLDQVRAGAVDLAFVTTPPSGTPGVTLTPLEEQPMVVACGPGHPLAGEDTVDLAKLAGETFVDFAPGWVTRDVTDHALHAAGVDRCVSLTVNDVHSLLDLVAQDLGIALVPDSFRHKQTSARFVSVAAPAPRWRTAVATVADRHPSAATRAFLAAESITP
ncbi:LysR family transcriptional regulator [Actinocatenispora rupis]|uniref:Transcriptional regulator n=1 Tax=Actinocatenispora rupis TaxID=519421 RepID=A0A8J3JAA1_9ACTN|nr:LysR family transcriptional regulator [Actinocatenispora rupis]GID12972.1 transcriptional regulator [Actinocatenispora rupis]